MGGALCGLRGEGLVGVACGGYRRTAQAQPWAQDRLQGKEADHQRKGEAKGCGEEVAHAAALCNREQPQVLPATERTVKVHQSRDLVTQGPCPSRKWAIRQRGSRLMRQTQKSPGVLAY